MNDITILLDVGCTIIIKLAVTCVLLALAKLILTYAKPRPQTLVWIGNGVTTANASGTSYQFLVAEPQLESPRPEAPKLEEELPQGVVCGNCQHEITTKPIERENLNQRVADIYRCENCGMRVRVPLAS